MSDGKALFQTVEALELLSPMEPEKDTNVDTVFRRVVKAALVEVKQKCVEKKEVLELVPSTT